jgi:thioredoxin 1
MVGDTTYVTLTKDNFDREVLKSHQPILVDFWADWCGPCHRIAPMIEELATEFAGRAKVGKLNVDQHTPVAAQFGIRSIPTLLFFRDGKVVDQVVGVAPKRVLTDKLDALLQAA